MSRAYLCVSIATESDKGRGGASRHPPSFEGIADGVLRRIQPLFERFGAKPTYLLSPDVLREAACLEAFRRLGSSCELGTHLDELEPDGAPANERQELTDLTDLFIRAFGHQPQSYRAGRSGLGPTSIGILESLGYVVESSVTPYVVRTSAERAGLSFPDAPTQPYRPDPADPGHPGESAILEVPVTIRRRYLSAIPGIGSRIAPRWLRPTRGTAEGLVRVAEDEIAAARRDAPSRPVILNAVLRNVEVVAGASPYGASDEEARGILDRLRALLVFARRAGIAVVGLADVPEILATSRDRGRSSS